MENTSTTDQQQPAERSPAVIKEAAVTAIVTGFIEVVVNKVLG